MITIFLLYGLYLKKMVPILFLVSILFIKIEKEHVKVIIFSFCSNLISIYIFLEIFD